MRKLTVLRVNEKKLTRRYVTLLEQEKHLCKENDKLKEESSQMQASVAQRLGYLQRYKVRETRESTRRLALYGQQQAYTRG